MKHGFAFKGEHFSDRGDFILLTPGNFKEEGGLKLKGKKEKFYAGEFPTEYLLRKGDLLLAMTDLTQNAPILGSPAFVPEDDRFLHNQRLGKVVVRRPDQIDAGFIFYLLNLPSVRGHIKGSASGATVRHTSPSRIYDVEVRIPPLCIQRRIAETLSKYDELIENNQRRIRILEEMARALYREWFVEFRFPGQQKAKSANAGSGALPSGWVRSRLGDVAEDVRRNVPKGELEEARPFVGLEHIPRRSLALDAWETVTSLGSNKLEFKRGEILFGKIRPYFHKVSIAPFDGLCSADTIVVRPKRAADFAVVAACIASDEFVSQASATANGAKMPRANWDVLKEFPIVLPPEGVAEPFRGLFEACVAQQQVLVQQVQNLRKTRDCLLPRLLSGQATVTAVGEEPAIL